MTLYSPFAKFAQVALFAQDETSLRVIEWSLPETNLGWTLTLGLFLLVAAWTVFVYLRDTKEFSPIITAWLTLLRVSVLVGLFVILLNPQERIQQIITRPSRLAVLVDTSLSMSDPEQLPPATADDSWSSRTRAEAVVELLDQSPALDQLRKVHDLHLYAFDSELRELGVLPQRNDEESESTEDEKPEQLDLEKLLTPAGRETRLGEAMAELLKTAGGPTLAGVVVVSDGGLNSGLDVSAALSAAEKEDRPVRIATVGVGDTRLPTNVAITTLRAPTDIRFSSERAEQDPFEVTAFLKSQGLAGQTVKVKLLRHPVGTVEETATEVDAVDVQLPEDDSPLEVVFTQQPDIAGKFRYLARVDAPEGVRDYRDDDNSRDLTINFLQRNTSVLLIAGGPTRDYRFARNLLYRSSTFDVDVWLQTVSPFEFASVSQESDDLLTSFPPDFPERPVADRLTEENAARTYDVVIAFDVDWSQLLPEQLEQLNNWVRRQRGGLILVAGDVFTATLAQEDEELNDIRDLYPVVLAKRFLFDATETDTTQPWPIGMTTAGEEAGFLRLSEAGSELVDVWKDFPGFYRIYPTRKAKDLATVQAVFTDPRAQAEGTPVLIATQPYGGGLVMYLGSPETWRLRALGEEYFNRFWVKAINEVGQGRLQQGDGPGVLLLDRSDFLLGETVRVRLQLNNVDEAAMADDLKLFVTGPKGRSLYPAGIALNADPLNPGQFIGSFRAATPGGHEIAVPLSDADSDDQLTANITVLVPQLERIDPRQNQGLLSRIAEETSSEYLPINTAAERLPQLFTTSAADAVRINESLQTLWDRQWLLLLLIGLLALEWLTRKILKLA
ncbi:vWA domain-containing protein [Calycomorphotria hydatis]|uniref:VWFA domain-containing protein n=1 Tax=Calycomorphotria hydatis TaxID=2528027 RepID=A0A517TAH1_9PLAN|nr:VWA domain-containing protein [Calycomorphotria hydatis]QDT65365.1 hypothetical protein V22_26180 [Calycomorphotria hydatis]